MPPPERSLCIIAADDHAGSLGALARLLRHHGHTVHTARTAAEVLALAAAHPCDLYIGDLGLEGASGLELMRQLRAQYGLRGIAVTGHTSDDDVTAALAAGYARHLAKPVVFTALLAAIDQDPG